MKFSYILASFVASAIITAQSTVNANLNAYTDNPLFTALLVFIAGLIGIFFIVLFHTKSRQAFLSVPKLVKSGELKWWHLTGGFTGATFVIVQSAIVSGLGVAIFTVTVVAAQTAGALFIDKAGFGPAGKQPVTLMKIISAVLGVVGVVVSVSGKTSDSNSSLGIFVAAAFAVSVLVATQPALNGQVAVKSGMATAATLVNFIGGLSLIIVANIVMYFVDPKPFVMPPLPHENLAIWLGGPFGIIFVLTAAAVAKPLGIFIFTLTSVLGQLSGAVLLDYFFPTEATDFNVRLFVGIAITAFAVVLASGGNNPSAPKRGTHRK